MSHQDKPSILLGKDFNKAVEHFTEHEQSREYGRNWDSDCKITRNLNSAFPLSELFSAPLPLTHFFPQYHPAHSTQNPLHHTPTKCQTTAATTAAMTGNPPPPPPFSIPNVLRASSISKSLPQKLFPVQQQPQLTNPPRPQQLRLRTPRTSLRRRGALLPPRPRQPRGRRPPRRLLQCPDPRGLPRRPNPRLLGRHLRSAKRHDAGGD